jgi:hypothetical protein
MVLVNIQLSAMYTITKYCFEKKNQLHLIDIDMHLVLIKMKVLEHPFPFLLIFHV